MSDSSPLHQVGQAVVVELLEEATMSDPGAIRPNASLLDHEGWDSMGMVMFISLVKERFGIELSAHDLRESTTAESLRARIESYVSD